MSPCEHYIGENICIKESSSLESKDLKTTVGNNSSGMHTMNDRKYDIKEINLLNERFCCHGATQVTESKEEKSNMENSNKCTLNAMPYTNDLERDVLNNSLRKIKTFPQLPSESDIHPHILSPLIMHNAQLPRKHLLNPNSLSLILNNEHSPLEGNSIKCDDNNQCGLIAEFFQKPDVNLEETCLRSKISPIYEYCTPSYKQSYFSQHSHSNTSDRRNITNSAEELNSSPEVLDNCKTWKCCNETSTSDKSGLLQINQKTTVFKPSSENGCRSTLLSPEEQNHSLMEDYYLEDKQLGGSELEMRTNEQVVETKAFI